jgi:bifunctional DNase/RNase
MLVQFFIDDHLETVPGVAAIQMLYTTFMKVPKHIKLTSYLLIFIFISCKQTPEITSNDKKVELEILSLSENGKGTGYYLLKLRAKQDSTRVLFMSLGSNEAQVLALSINNTIPEYPLPLDLFEQLTQKLNFKISEVIIDDIKDEVFTAKILGYSNKTLIELKARPSDAITIATKLKCPIYVIKGLLP